MPDLGTNIDSPELQHMLDCKQGKHEALNLIKQFSFHHHAYIHVQCFMCNAAGAKIIYSCVMTKPSPARNMKKRMNNILKSCGIQVRKKTDMQSNPEHLCLH